jgi:hypothetical protein
MTFQILFGICFCRTSLEVRGTIYVTSGGTFKIGVGRSVKNSKKVFYVV